MAQGRRTHIAVAHTAQEFVYLSSDLKGWAVTGRYSERGSELTIEEIRLQPESVRDSDDPAAPAPPAPAGGVTGEHLRLIPVGRIKAKIARERAQLVQQVANAAASETDAEVRRALGKLMPSESSVAAGRRAQRTAAPQLPESFLRRVAIAWVEEAQRGRGAWARMLERFAADTASVETIRRWIKRARAEGWLAPQSGPNQGRGQLIAEPGPKLIAYRAERARRAQKEKKS